MILPGTGPARPFPDRQHQWQFRDIPSRKVMSRKA